MLDHKIARDKRLGWSARGVLIYLLTRPDNWQVSVPNLMNEVGESSQRTGRDATYKIINQLIEAGYMARVQNRNADGSLGEQEIIVGEDPEIVAKCVEDHKKEPLTEKPEAVQPPLPDLPDTELPDTGSPDTVKRTQRYNEYKDIPNIKAERGEETRARKTPDPNISAAYRATRKKQIIADDVMRIRVLCNTHAIHGRHFSSNAGDNTLADRVMELHADGITTDQLIDALRKLPSADCNITQGISQAVAMIRSAGQKQATPARRCTACQLPASSFVDDGRCLGCYSDGVPARATA